VDRLQRSTDDPARARELIAGHAEPAVPGVQAVLQRFMAAPKAVQVEALSNHLRALKGLFDLRAAYPANAQGDDQTLLRFAQRAMPEFRALMAHAVATGAVPVPPDNRPSVDWLLGPSTQNDYPVDDRPGTLPRPARALQAGIVTKAAGATHGALFLLAVSDAAQARAWLATLPVTPGDQQPLKRGGLLRQLAFTREGLQALLDLMGQGFDGGTDVQGPIERAIERVHEARWSSADLLIVSDGEFGCVPATLARLDDARERFGLRVEGVLVGDRETMGLMEVADHIHWVRDWRAHGTGHEPPGFSPVHSKSLTALYFPGALSPRAARHAAEPPGRS